MEREQWRAFELWLSEALCQQSRLLEAIAESLIVIESRLSGLPPSEAPIPWDGCVHQHWTAYCNSCQSMIDGHPQMQRLREMWAAGWRPPSAGTGPPTSGPTSELLPGASQHSVDTQEPTI